LISLDVEMGLKTNRTPLSNYIMEVTNMATKKATVKSEAKSTEISTAKIQFVFNAPEAQKVSLGGDFNGWDTFANPMKKDKKGIWKVTVNMKPGRYEYRFFVDENWENDPSCTECVPNNLGSMNCIRIVE
jgi:1,4-alpha-glucan branching enzyme